MPGDPRAHRAGRPKGVPNKATVEHKEWLRSVFESEEYRTMFLKKLRRGTLPPNIWQDCLNRCYGKVPSQVNVGGSVLEKLLAQGQTVPVPVPVPVEPHDA